MVRKEKNSIMPKSLKLLLRILGFFFGFFLITFTVYILNLDMKLTAMIEPFLLQHYDRIERNRHL